MFAKKKLFIVVQPIQFLKMLFYRIGLTLLSIITGLGVVFSVFYYTLPQMENYRFSDLKKTARKIVYKKMVNKKTPYKWVPIEQINQDFIYAVTIAEDATFFEHNGINYDAIIDAIAEDIKQEKFAYGASTISQQVAKNLFLSSQKTFLRKIKEFFITRDLEKRFSKNQLIELYLNVAQFGPDIFGVNSAANYFFNKKPSRINAAEGAFISLMLPSPRKNHYSVYKNRNISISKRKKLQRIFKEMYYNEYITKNQYDQYLSYSYFQ